MKYSKLQKMLWSTVKSFKTYSGNTEYCKPNGINVFLKVMPRKKRLKVKEELGNRKYRPAASSDPNFAILRIFNITIIQLTGDQ